MYNYVNYHIILHNRHEADSCLEIARLRYEE